MNSFQEVYCMTTARRENQRFFGPYELLQQIKQFIVETLPEDEQKHVITISRDPTTEPAVLPLAIAMGYYVLKRVTTYMGRKK